MAPEKDEYTIYVAGELKKDKKTVKVRRSCHALAPWHPCAGMLRVLGGHGRQRGRREARNDDTVQPVFKGAAMRPACAQQRSASAAVAHSSGGGQHRLLGCAWGSAYPASWPVEPAGAGLTRALRGGRGAGLLADDGRDPGGGAAAAAPHAPRMGPAVCQREQRDGGAAPGQRAGRKRGRGQRRPRRGAPQRRRRAGARRRRMQGAHARGAPPLVVSCACSWSLPAPPFTTGSTRSKSGKFPYVSSCGVSRVAAACTVCKKATKQTPPFARATMHTGPVLLLLANVT